MVSEINYNPSSSGDLTEFVELLNITGDILDLSGCHFDDETGGGFSYVFPANTQLAGGGRLLVVKNAAAMAAMYGAGLNMVGDFVGALSNSGESMVLYAANGQEIFRFAYKDNIAAADGEGKSLVRVISSSSPDPVDYTWRASTQDNGNPGTSDAVAFTGDPLADADGDGAAALMEYAFGSSDANAASKPGEPVIILSGGGILEISWPLALNADDVRTTIQGSYDLSAWSTWNPAAAGPVPARYFRLLVEKK